MKILKKTKALKKNKSQLSLAEQVDDTNFARNCQLTCRGKYNWKQKLISVYGSYAMLVEKCFFDLPASTFLVYCVNEHAKGGHHEHEFQLMNTKGKVFCQFNSRHFSKFIIDDRHLWFLQSRDKSFRTGESKAFDLVKLNFKTGKIKKRINLDYEKLINIVFSYVLNVELVEKHNKVFIKIMVVIKPGQTQAVKIPLL